MKHLNLFKLFSLLLNANNVKIREINIGHDKMQLFPKETKHNTEILEIKTNESVMQKIKSYKEERQTFPETRNPKWKKIKDNCQD